MRALALSAVTLLATAFAAAAQAQLPPRITLLVGFGPGQGNDQPARPDAAAFAANRMSPDMSYDQTARFLARRLPARLPGTPMIEARHAPGGAGFEAARRLGSAPANGGVIALLSANAIYASALRLPGADFDAGRFTWLGGVASERWACIRRVGAKSPAWTGTTGAGSRADAHARAMTMTGVAQLAVMAGYASRFELIRSLETGEIDAACGWPMRDLETRRSDWFATRRFEMFAIFSPTSKGALAPPNDPLAADVLEALAWEAEIAWPLAAPPGLAPAAANAFTQALEALANDPDALAEAERAGIVLEPVAARRVADIARALHASPEPARAALKALFTPAEATPQRATRRIQ